MESMLIVRGSRILMTLGASLVGSALLSACGAAETEPTEPEQPSGEVSSSVVPGCCNGPASEPLINGFRLSISPLAVPTTTTASQTVYAAPYKSQSISLYDGTAWISRIASDTPSLAIPATPINANYDVYAYWDGSNVKLEIAPWQSGKARQNGVYIRASDVSRRFLGSVGVGSSGLVLDLPTNRLVWNQDNQVPRTILVTYGASWYLTGNNTWRDLGGSTATRAEVLAGGMEEGGTFLSVRADNSCVVNAPAATNSLFATGIGIDSTTPVSQMNVNGAATNAVYGTSYSFYESNLAVGRHTVRWLEIGYTGVTYFCYGYSGTPPFGRSGLTGFVTM